MYTLQIIIQGAITGVVLTMSFGAGFFALVQTSITRGYKKGLLIATGAIICDAVFIFISIFATSFISEEMPKYASTVRLTALIAFLVLGIHSILKSSNIKNNLDQTQKPGYLYITKGIILNIVNPLVLVTWLGITLFLESNLKYSSFNLFIFFFAVLVATFGSQTVVCFFSHKIKNYLSSAFIHKMNIVIGVLFIVIGIVIYLNTGNSELDMNQAKDLLN
jgi:threonine/homoserine/homoserine lactone efflux protein